MKFPLRLTKRGPVRVKRVDCGTFNRKKRIDG
jgi:hypothetical protein